MKEINERKLEIMQDIATLVRAHKERNLGQNMAERMETPEYKNCTDFCTKMNMELSAIENVVPDEAKPIYKIRMKIAMLKGVQAFGDPAQFLRWIDKQNETFGGESWRSLLNTSDGLHQVLDTLEARNL